MTRCNVVQQISRACSSYLTESLCLVISNFPFPSPPHNPWNHHSTFWFYGFDYFSVSHKWKYAVFVFLWLVNFRQHDALKVPLCFDIPQNFLLCKGCIVFHYRCLPHGLHPFIHWRALRLFPCPGSCEECWHEHWGCRYLFKILIWTRLDKYPGLGSLDHMVILDLIFGGPLYCCL